MEDNSCILSYNGIHGVRVTQTAIATCLGANKSGLRLNGTLTSELGRETNCQVGALPKRRAIERVIVNGQGSR